MMIDEEAELTWADVAADAATVSGISRIPKRLRRRD